MATSGWSKCKKKFSGGFGKTIFAGFDREIWEKRSNKDHRNFAVRVRLLITFKFLPEVRIHVTH